jgi:hypothetical protein
MTRWFCEVQGSKTYDETRSKDFAWTSTLRINVIHRLSQCYINIRHLIRSQQRPPSAASSPNTRLKASGRSGDSHHTSDCFELTYRHTVFRTSVVRCFSTTQ